MEKLRFEPDAATGIAMTATSRLASMTDRRKLCTLVAVGVGVVAAARVRDRRVGRALEDRVAAMNEQIRQLEHALAAQVQSRMTAESAVTSLSDRLSEAEHRAGPLDEPVVMSLADASEAGLTDPLTGLFNHEYFLVTLDLRIAAARRHLRPVAVTMIQVVEGLHVVGRRHLRHTHRRRCQGQGRPGRRSARGRYARPGVQEVHLWTERAGAPIFCTFSRCFEGF